MRRYLAYSLAIHATLLVALVVITYWLSPRQRQSMRFVVLPKGTSLDAVLTPESLQAKRTEASAATAQGPASLGATPSPTTRPTATPEETAGLESPTPRPAASPSPGLTRQASPPAPSPTASPTPTAHKTISAPSKVPHTSSPTPKQPAATAPGRRKTPLPSPTRGQPKPKATPATQGTKRPAASAYDLAGPAEQRGGVRQEMAAGRTPMGLTPRAARPGEQVGIPGIPEGVEGAPLPLDRQQSMLSMLYATRARMKIQSNFTVPPDVNDPAITCVVEWEILPDGTIQNIRVVKSTGTARLDACAVDAVRKTENLGPLPPEWGGRSVWTSLTFVFAGDGSEAHPEDGPAPASADPRATQQRLAR